MPEPLPTTCGSPPQDVTNTAPPTTTHKKRHNADSRIRRRNRVITSCLECRSRKLKCDKQQPCTHCTRFSRPCIFIASSLDPAAQAKLNKVKEKMGALEKMLGNDKSRRVTPRPLFEAPSLPGQDLNPSDEEEEEDTKDLKFLEIATEHANYYEDEGNDDVVDLGISLGKVWITERVGGLVRPRLSEELNEALRRVPDVDQSRNPYAGQPPESWISPSGDFIAPPSSIYFTPGVEKTPMVTHLPNKVLVDKLMAHYWEVVHPITRTLHRPSFELKYDSFWKSMASGIEPSKSFQAVIFTALLNSVVSMTASKTLTEYSVEKQSLVENFRIGSESALARANFLCTTKLETLQATIMYLVALCGAEVSRAHSALTGAVIRLSECMGLHRDPSAYSTNPVEIQIRRLMWYQLCWLDLRTCDATGPRPQIRRDEYDTRFPLNVDDDDLELAAQRGDNITQDSKSFTLMTITRMRLECFELYRMIWNERPKLQRKAEPGEKKTTLTGLLARIQSFRAAMEKEYLPMMSRDNPLHAVAIELYGIMSSRLYLAVLHPLGDKGKMPERLHQIIISSSIMIAEHSMNINQQPALSKWSFYVTTLHQYHSALILLQEVPAMSDPMLLARIWRCLDYTFELPASLDNNEKTSFILGELVERTGSYATQRRVRAPSDMPHVSPRPKEGPQEWQRSWRMKSVPQTQHAGPHRDSELHGQRRDSPNSDTPLYAQYPNPQEHPGRPFNPAVLPDMGRKGGGCGIPQVEWTTPVDMDTQSLPQLLPATSTETYNFGGFASFDQPPSSMAPLYPVLATDTTPPKSPVPVPEPLAGTSNTGVIPTEALFNEIDWNEWDAIFGAAQMGPGNVVIPPFTFPSFEPDAFQWDAGGAPLARETQEHGGGGGRAGV